MRIIAIDYGLSRTGIAVSDPTGLIASPFRVLPSRNYEALLQGISSVLEEIRPDRIIIGYPSRTDGKASEMCQRVDRFCTDLNDRFGVFPLPVDEKYTTLIASRQLHESGKRAKEQRKSIDAAAAAVLLQGYLDSLR